jgi:hypothetical protein
MMALYSKRFSTVTVECSNLYNEEGETVPSVEVEQLVIKAGDRDIVVKVRRGGTQLGELGRGSRVELEVQERAGITTKRSLFKVDL